MDDRASRRGCNASTDQGMECCIETHQAMQLADCALALLSVRRGFFIASGSEVTGVLFLPLSQRESFDCVDGPVAREKKVDNAACELPGPASHAMRLFTLEFFDHLHSLLRKNAYHVLEDRKLFEWSAVEQLCSTALALLLMYETYGNETVHLLEMEGPATRRAEVVKIHGEKIAVLAKPSFRVELGL